MRDYGYDKQATMEAIDEWVDYQWFEAENPEYSEYSHYNITSLNGINGNIVAFMVIFS